MEEGRDHRPRLSRVIFAESIGSASVKHQLDIYFRPGTTVIQTAALDAKTNLPVKPLWLDNELQFARLLAEFLAVAPPSIKGRKALCETMDLSAGQLEKLFDRAQSVWDEARAAL